MATETSDRIEYFGGPFRFLSNFYEVPVLYEGVIYPSAEHAFQAAKTYEPQAKVIIGRARTAGDAKRIGNDPHITPMRSDWDEVKIDVMGEIVLAKFQQNPSLREKLLSTGDAELVEGNSHGDRFWGVTADGSGENHLGRILMRIREFLRQT